MKNTRQFNHNLRKAGALLTLVAFFVNTVLPASAQSVLGLPAPGTMLTVSAAFHPPIMRGVKINPDNPLQFDFYIDTGDDNLQGKVFEDEAAKLIKYFLASITVPEKEFWVNLSPYEKDRIVPDGLGVTELGRDMLKQDYLLKQITASMVYPEEHLGSEFWKRVYAKAQEQYGTTDIPVDTFNKVWIVPDKAVVYEKNGSAFVGERHLKVMLEQDYLALEHSRGSPEAQHPSDPGKSGILGTGAPGSRGTGDPSQVNSLGSAIVREVILPELEKEINEGKNFANLRQIYNSMILATWYKQTMKESLLGQVYMDKNKVKGVDVEDKAVKQKIYEQYLEAFKKGVYNYIKEDEDPLTKEVIPRKYFSGGLVAPEKVEIRDPGQLPPNAAVKIYRSESGEVNVVAVAMAENAGEGSIVAQQGRMRQTIENGKVIDIVRGGQPVQLSLKPGQSEAQETAADKKYQTLNSRIQGVYQIVEGLRDQIQTGTIPEVLSSLLTQEYLGSNNLDNRSLAQLLTKVLEARLRVVKGEYYVDAVSGDVMVIAHAGNRLGTQLGGQRIWLGEKALESLTDTEVIMLMIEDGLHLLIPTGVDDRDVFHNTDFLEAIGRKLEIKKAQEAVGEQSPDAEMQRTSTPGQIQSLTNKANITDLSNQEIQGKTFFVRVDLNVSLDNDGQISDDTRIKATLDTIEYIASRGGKIILASYLGDPQEEITQEAARLGGDQFAEQARKNIEKKLSLAIVAQRLRELLPDRTIHFNPDYRSSQDLTTFVFQSMKKGDVVLLENVRFNKNETAKEPDQGFVQAMFQGVDFFVLDGFGVSHRNHVSVVGASATIPRLSGLLVKKELDSLGRVLNDVAVAVMGGSKVSNKIAVINALLGNQQLKHVLIGGAMANAFFKAGGISVGASIGVDANDVALASKLMNDQRIELPVDVVIASAFDPSAQHETRTVAELRSTGVPDGWMIVDIGPETVARYESLILNSESGRSIFWNGPMGAFDRLNFAQDGTKGIAFAIDEATKKGLYTVVGGGESVTAVNQFGVKNVSHISTGGGASLQLLGGEQLPGIARLSNRSVVAGSPVEAARMTYNVVLPSEAILEQARSIQRETGNIYNFYNRGEAGHLQIAFRNRTGVIKIENLTALTMHEWKIYVAYLQYIEDTNPVFQRIDADGTRTGLTEQDLPQSVKEQFGLESGKRQEAVGKQSPGAEVQPTPRNQGGQIGGGLLKGIAAAVAVSALSAGVLPGSVFAQGVTPAPAIAASAGGAAQIDYQSDEYKKQVEQAIINRLKDLIEKYPGGESVTDLYFFVGKTEYFSRRKFKEFIETFGFVNVEAGLLQALEEGRQELESMRKYPLDKDDIDSMIHRAYIYILYGKTVRLLNKLGIDYDKIDGDKEESYFKQGNDLMQDAFNRRELTKGREFLLKLALHFVEYPDDATGQVKELYRRDPTVELATLLGAEYYRVYLMRRDSGNGGMIQHRAAEWFLGRIVEYGVKAAQGKTVDEYFGPMWEQDKVDYGYVKGSIPLTSASVPGSVNISWKSGAVITGLSLGAIGLFGFAAWRKLAGRREKKGSTGGRRTETDASAQPKVKKVGGIDFNAELLNLQIKRDGNGIPLPISQQPIENMNIEGFLPVIINVTPVTPAMLLSEFSSSQPDYQLTQI